MLMALLTEPTPNVIGGASCEYRPVVDKRGAKAQEALG